VDASEILYAAGHTTLFFSLRPATGAFPTPPTVSDQATMLRYSRTHR
jgi:hypothetical protein